MTPSYVYFRDWVNWGVPVCYGRNGEAFGIYQCDIPDCDGMSYSMVFNENHKKLLTASLMFKIRVIVCK